MRYVSDNHKWVVIGLKSIRLEQQISISNYHAQILYPDYRYIFCYFKKNSYKKNTSQNCLIPCKMYYHGIISYFHCTKVIIVFTVT